LEVFRQITEDPRRVDLLREYVRLSVLLEDFESAAAQLEVLSSLDPTDSSVAVALAEAYLSLEAFEVSIAEASRVQTLDAAPEELSQAQRVLSEAEEGLSRSQLEASLSLGGAYSFDDRHLAPFAAAQVLWNYDVGAATPTDWQTILDWRSEHHDGGFDQHFLLRTGPKLPLESTTSSNVVQPFLQIYRDETRGMGTSTEYFVGLAYVPHSSGVWSHNLEVLLGRASVNPAQDRETALRFGFGVEREIGAFSSLSFQAGVQAFPWSSGSDISAGAAASFETTLQWASEAVGVPLRLSVHVAYGAVEHSDILLVRRENDVHFATDLTLDLNEDSFISFGYAQDALSGRETEHDFTVEYGWRF